MVRSSTSYREFLGAAAGGIVCAAWVAPVVATVVTLSGYFVPSAFHGWNPVVAGIVIGVATWAATGLVVSPFVSSRERSNPASWAEAASRLCELDAQLADPNHLAEVGCIMQEIRRMGQYGFRWATKSGYIGLWQAIHRAEEALVEVSSSEALWTVVENDTLRLADAQGISPFLAPALMDVVTFMAAPAAAPAGPGPAPAPPPVQLGRRMPPVSGPADARSRLRAITAAINAFRDNVWAGLVRLRLRLLAALCLTETFAYALLAFVVLLGVGHTQMIAAITFFLVAAVTGFVGQLLMLEDRTSEAVDDYGLSLVRLLLIPVVAGLAGLGGVVLTALLLNAPFTSLVLAASAARAGGPLPSLLDVFDLDRNRGGIVFAILFGYAPYLLVTRLDNLVAAYKSAISSTEAGTTG